MKTRTVIAMLAVLFAFWVLVAVCSNVSDEEEEGFFDAVVIRRKHCAVNGHHVLEMPDTPVIMTPTTEAA